MLKYARGKYMGGIVHFPLSGLFRVRDRTSRIVCSRWQLRTPQPFPSSMPRISKRLARGCGQSGSAALPARGGDIMYHFVIVMLLPLLMHLELFYPSTYSEVHVHKETTITFYHFGFATVQDFPALTISSVEITYIDLVKIICKLCTSFHCGRV